MSEKKKNWNSYIPIGVFVIFFAAFTLVSILIPKKDFSEEENRALQERPELEADAILEGEYQESYENYLCDQFPARGLFVSLKTGIQLLAGKRDINHVYLGRDGYLIEKYTDADFDPVNVDDNEWFLSAYLADMVKTYGKDHVKCMIVPSKGTVLKDKMPPYAKAFDTSGVLEGVQDYLKEEDITDEVLVDLTDTLSRHSKEYIYYRTDHHWTTLGAYYAYAHYKQMCGQEAPDADSFEKETVSRSFYGTTYDKVQKKTVADEVIRWRIPGEDSVKVVFDDGENEWETFYDESALDQKDKYSYFLGGNTAKIHISTGCKNDRTLLLVKDSFSNSLVEFLSQDYANIYMIDLRYGNETIYEQMASINEEHPITDILVVYNTEKFMTDENQYLLEPEEVEDDLEEEVEDEAMFEEEEDVSEEE